MYPQIRDGLWSGSTKQYVLAIFALWNGLASLFRKVLSGMNFLSPRESPVTLSLGSISRMINSVGTTDRVVETDGIIATSE